MQMGEKLASQSGTHMTHVVLTNGEDDLHIEFPIEPCFQAYLKKVRQLVPSRKYEIFETWETV